MQDKKIIALIPAKGDSTRIPKKNIIPLGGHPLIAYTIHAAIQSGIFESIYVSTDSQNIAFIAEKYGIGTMIAYMRTIRNKNGTILERSYIDTEITPDILWVKDVLSKIEAPDYFMILRPTSPFRTEMTIKRAWRQYQDFDEHDSMKSVERCKQHPYKQWEIDNDYLISLSYLKPRDDNQRGFELPYQSLPEIYAQNGCIDIGETRNVIYRNTVFGEKIMPFFTEGYEGFDLNRREDLILAEALIERGLIKLPKIK